MKKFVLNMRDPDTRRLVAQGDAVYVGRPTKWGNPYVEGRDGSREQVIEKYRRRLLSNTSLQNEARQRLRGKYLACWCAPLPCHADVLLDFVMEERG